MTTPSLPPSGAVEELRRLITGSRHAVIFTGAGISTESGIPDFRGPEGVWSRMPPIYFQDFLASATTRHQAWERRFSNQDGWVGARPNRGHWAVAKWVASGTAVVITQNVDNLHQASGVPEDKIIELHGNSTYAQCLKCHTRYELAVLELQFKTHGNIDPCSSCGGLIKTATISFGQTMPELPMQRATKHTLQCDLFVVLGSSLSVFPAADFPRRAKHNGAALVIVNREPTEMDSIADLVIRAGIGDTMSAALAR